MEKRFNLPNTLTVLRFVLSPVFFYFLLIKEINYALISFMFVAVTDFADGWIARSTQQQTKFGELLDPLADKFMILLAVIALVISFDFPPVAVPLFLMRDLISLFGGILLFHKSRKLWKPKSLGKATTFFQIATVICFIIDIKYKSEIMWFTVLLSIITATVYIYRGIRVWANNSE